jgi:hypothetical protein
MAQIPLLAYSHSAKYSFDPLTGVYQVYEEDFRWPDDASEIGYGAEIVEGLRHRRPRLFMALYEDGQTLRFTVEGQTFDALDPRFSIARTDRFLKRGFIVRMDGRDVYSTMYSLVAWHRSTDSWDGSDLIDYIQELRGNPAAIERLRNRWGASRAALRSLER